MTGPVGLVIVSHSARLADGVVELAGQMAPGVAIVAAGGLPGGGIGTDFAKVGAAVAEADAGAGVVLLFDLGSAQMTADMVVETLDDPARAIVADAPLVEGAVAAAVAAAGGASLADVAAAAHGATQESATQESATEKSATEESAASPNTGVSSDTVPSDTVAPDTVARAEIVLHNEVGLHARPAAALARSLTGLSADVTVRFGDREADARSVLALLGLSARQGDHLTVSAQGPDATEALARIERLADDNFGE